MILIAILAQLAVTSPRVDVASERDCAVLIEIGRSLVNWGATGPDQPFVDSGPLSDGATYRQACDWKKFGVGAPQIVQPGQTGPRFAVDKPAYAKDGRSACVNVTFISWAGPGASPFISVKHCELRRSDGQWRLVACTQDAIT
jgi:hypothetical protein